MVERNVGMKFRKLLTRRWIERVCGVLAALSTGLWPAVVTADEVVDRGLRIRSSNVTGRASFVTAADGGTIPVDQTIAVGAVTAEDIIREHGHLFGVRDRASELLSDAPRTDAIGQKHTTYRQVFRGVPVFGGTLRVHQDARGGIRAANGDFYPIRSDLDVRPNLTKEQAVEAAKRLVGSAAANVERAELTIVDPGWYGDPVVGAHLVYHVVVSDLRQGIREAFFIDAHSGKQLDRWSLELGKNRRVMDGSINGPVLRSEGDPPTGDADADAAYDYAGDTYDYLFRAFGRDGLNGFGMRMNAVVHLSSSGCPNAFGGAGDASFCDGTASDDVVAHEFGHSLTEFTAGLTYKNQPGQLNESFSDVFGEIVDLLNGDASSAGTPGGTPWPSHPTGSGTDTPNNLRNGCSSDTLMIVNAPPAIAGDYSAQPASFGPALTVLGTTGDIVVAQPYRACDVDLPFSNAPDMAGKIVLVTRGDCLFAEKVRNAQDEGAIAVIVANNLSSGMSPMGGSDASITIPSVGSTRDDGDLIKAAAATSTVNVTLRAQTDMEVRWLVGEDAWAFGGAIRDMWQPSCAGDPDTANHPLQLCNPDDNGGVHSGSGVANHAFAIATDGKSFNGQTVNPIGLFKAGAVWYRALTVYLTQNSDFEDAYAAFNQSASDLVGTMIEDPRDGSDFGIFTSADAAEVDKALLAVEMNTPGACGRSELLDTTPPEQCPDRSFAFADDFESGVNGWTVSNTSPPTPYDWEQIGSQVPFGRAGTVWRCRDLNVGNCSSQDESAIHSLISPEIFINVTATAPTLAFTHYISTEAFYDGGNVRIGVDGGAWQLIPREAFTFNGYNGAFAQDNTNPLAGEVAFTGSPLTGGGWGTSLVDLGSFFATTGPHTAQFKFDLSKDGCSGIDGWYLDDVEVYTCRDSAVPPELVPDPDAKTNRYVRFSAPGGGTEEAIRVKFVDLPGFMLPNPDYLWVSEPFDAPEENSSSPGLTFRAAALSCVPHFRDWSTQGILSVFGAEIAPGSVYEVQRADISCPDLTDENCFSPAVTITTGKFGDVTELFDDPDCLDPPGPCNPPQPDFSDVAALVRKFTAAPDAPIKAVAQLQPNVVFPNRSVDFKDISADVSAFVGVPFPSLFPGPCVCPPVVTCGITACANDLQCPGGLCVGGFCADACGRCAP